ncbi:hypothetical protein BU16DRAFT_561742 [Lophium mytilinum]|uniref:Uncharacterized protein n=1 Tax=Lophium mytilinum TaxID=390894 RepID=A0A6A6QTF3_9PEZI|nr:hypothetical protein BU16DRAFT_561742 [Lophium mytilinum]
MSKIGTITQTRTKDMAIGTARRRTTTTTGWGMQFLIAVLQMPWARRKVVKLSKFLDEWLYEHPEDPTNLARYCNEV